MPPGILRFPLISFERPRYSLLHCKHLDSLSVIFRYIDFATLGIVIGHEIAHSMDSNSKKFMTYQNGTSWWTSDINSAYQEKAKCFAQQYSEYLVESADEYVRYLLLSILFYTLYHFLA